MRRIRLLRTRRRLCRRISRGGRLRLRACGERLEVREASVAPAEPAQANDQRQRDDRQENQTRIRFVFFVILEQIVQIASFVGWRSQVEHPAGVCRSRSRRFRFAGNWGGRWFRSCFDEWAAAHAAEAVVAGIFIATMGAAHDYVFPWSKPTRSSDPRSRSS